MTARGIRQAFVLEFLNVKTRRVILSPTTYQPNAEWIEAQAESFVDQAREEGLPVARLMRDRDGAFTQVFDDALRRRHVKVLKTQFRAPNAYVERFVQSIKQECLDHFVIFGAQHMDVLCREYLDYYHHERPHQSKDNLPLVQQNQEGLQRGENSGNLPLSQIACRQRLGGLLKHYYRKAA
ncbi:MAG: integrase core domain-containing protein [Pirellulales bacterium]